MLKRYIYLIFVFLLPFLKIHAKEKVSFSKNSKISSNFEKLKTRKISQLNWENVENYTESQLNWEKLKDWKENMINNGEGGMVEPKLLLSYLQHHKTNILKVTKLNESL